MLNLVANVCHLEDAINEIKRNNMTCEKMSINIVGGKLPMIEASKLLQLIHWNKNVVIFNFQVINEPSFLGNRARNEFIFKMQVLKAERLLSCYSANCCGCWF
jgi:hypothetical protein